MDIMQDTRIVIGIQGFRPKLRGGVHGYYAGYKDSYWNTGIQAQAGVG